MPPAEIRLRVIADTVFDGVAVPAGDYPGLYYKRNSVNGPNGIAETWELCLPNHGNTGSHPTGRVNVTLQIRAGEMIELD